MTALLVITTWFLAGIGVAYVLSKLFRAGRAAEKRDEADRLAREAEWMTRYAEHRPCPWDLKR